jgi:hypothetical protein
VASAGYGTETTVESIWSANWDTTQFDHINKLIGTEFNFYITQDGGTDIIDTKVTTMLAAQTHKLFARWNALIKSSAVVNPWDFINILISEMDFKREFNDVIEAAKIILGESKIEMVTRRLPTTTDSNVIP